MIAPSETISLNLPELCERFALKSREIQANKGTDRDVKDRAFGCTFLSLAIGSTCVNYLRGWTSEQAGTFARALKGRRRPRDSQLDFRKIEQADTTVIRKMCHQRSLYIAMLADVCREKNVSDLPLMTMRSPVAFGTIAGHAQAIVDRTDHEVLETLAIHTLQQQMNTLYVHNMSLLSALHMMQKGVWSKRQIKTFKVTSLDQEELHQRHIAWKRQAEYYSERIQNEGGPRDLCLFVLSNTRYNAQTIIALSRLPQVQEYPGLTTIIPVSTG